MNSGDPAVIFLHIPKTGGTTLQHILQRCYPRNQICTFKDANRQSQIENFKALTTEKRRAYQLIQGHLHFGFHRHLPGDSIYITLLREPIARTLSFYYYAKSHPDHYLYSSLTNDHVDLRALLNEPTTMNSELFNLQTRMIAGDEGGDPNRLADGDTVQRAKENLQNHFVVGLTEEFDASLRLMSERFGWNVKSYTKKNVTRRKPRIDTLDAETLASLRRANTLDIELYRFARELFEAQRLTGAKSSKAFVSSR
jgi:Galactose-3-O-sulfotransferase